MCGPTVYSTERAQQGVTARAEASGRDARSFCGLQARQCLNIWKEWGGCSVLGGD